MSKNRRRKKIIDLGREARLAGKTRHACPPSFRGGERLLWLQGFEEARERPQVAEQRWPVIRLRSGPFPDTLYRG